MQRWRSRLTVVAAAFLLTACPVTPEFGVASFAASSHTVPPGSRVRLAWSATAFRNACYLQASRASGDDESELVDCIGAREVTVHETVIYQFAALIAEATYEERYVTITATTGDAALTVSPGEITINVDAHRTIRATFDGGDEANLVWAATRGSVTGAGATITYHSPATPGPDQVTVTSTTDPGVAATATITVELVAITVEPQAETVRVGQTRAITATVSGTADTRVTWATTCGVIDGTGNTVTYMPPSYEAACAATATSTADTRRSGTATLSIRLPPSGDIEWSRVFGSADQDRVTDVAIGPNGTTYVVGTTTGDALGMAGGGTDVFILTYAADGVASWRRQYGSALEDRPMLVVPRPDGSVLVGGSRYGTTGDPPTAAGTLFLRTDTSNPYGSGATLEFGNPEQARDAADMVLDADGNILVAGEREGDALLMKFDPDGNELWSRLMGLYQANATSLVVDAQGNAIVTGNSYKTSFVAKVDPNGNQLWVLNVAGGYTTAGDVAVDAEGSIVYVGVESYPPTPMPAVGVLLSLDAGGNVLRRSDIDPAADTSARTVAISSDGSIVVAGTTRGDLGGDDPAGRAFVAKYGADGHRFWVRQLGPAGVSPVGPAMHLAVADDGTAVLASTFPGLLDDRPDPDGSGDDVLVIRLAP
jgi:hypothetical protein